MSEPLNLESFWTRLIKLGNALMREGAHCEIVIQLQAGRPHLVKINRNYLAAALPDLPVGGKSV